MSAMVGVLGAVTMVLGVVAMSVVFGILVLVVHSQLRCWWC